MGIQNFFEVLREGLIPCHLADLRVQGGRRIVAGVDTSCFLYRGLHATEGPQDYIANLGRFLKSQGMDVIFALDGLKYPPKEHAYKKRLPKIDPGALVFRDEKFYKELIRKLDQAGHKYVSSVYEADPQLAVMCRDGIIDLVITEDTDLVVYGCPYILYKVNVINGEALFFDQSCLDFIFKQGYNPDLLRRLCVAIGSDYSSGVKGLGVGKAVEVYPKMDPTESITEFLRKVKELFPNNEGIEEEIEKAEMAFLYHPVWDLKNKEIVPFSPYPTDETKIKALAITGTGESANFQSNIDSPKFHEKNEIFFSTNAVFRCPRCTDAFTTRQEMRNHFQSHKICTECNSKFSTRYDLNVHMAVHSKERLFICPECGKDFKGLHHLKIHRKFHKEPRFTCNTCHKKFQTGAQLRRHNKLHTGERPHQCIFCGKGFIELNTMFNHINSHTKEKPYFCKFCDECFATAQNLAGHMSTHTGEKKYRCKVCNKEFGKYSHMLRHKNIHTQKKIYTCKTCGKGFGVDSNLRRHEKIAHSDARPFVCEKCGTGFKEKCKLTRHINTVHAA